MWVELAVGVVSLTVGIIASVAIAVKQTSDQRIILGQLNDFFYDWRAEHTYRLERIDETINKILEKLG